MKMANLSLLVWRYFDVNHLDRHFAIHESVEEAKRAFPGAEADHAS
jgi:hypothetical protein